MYQKLLVETVAFALLMFHFWAATVLTFSKNNLELLKEKALKMIPKHERTKAQISLGVAERIIFEIVSHFN